MEDKRMNERKKRLKKFNQDWEAAEKRKLIDVNYLPFEEDCADLIITKLNSDNVNEPLLAKIFNNQKSITIGCFVIPNQFDEINTQEQFIADYESIRDQFDALLLMSSDSNFTDFGFKELFSNDENNSLIHYRNSCFNFESFKDIFKSKSIVIMRTAIASGSNRAMVAAVSAFEFSDFFRNQISEIKSKIVCVSSGNPKCTNDEENEICKFSIDRIKRDMTLGHTTFEDLSLGNNIRVSVIIGGFESIK